MKRPEVVWLSPLHGVSVKPRAVTHEEVSHRLSSSAAGNGRRSRRRERPRPPSIPDWSGRRVSAESLVLDAATRLGVSQACIEDSRPFGDVDCPTDEDFARQRRHTQSATVARTSSLIVTDLTAAGWTYLGHDYAAAKEDEGNKWQKAFEHALRNLFFPFDRAHQGGPLNNHRFLLSVGAANWTSAAESLEEVPPLHSGSHRQLTSPCRPPAQHRVRSGTEQAA